MSILQQHSWPTFKTLLTSYWVVEKVEGIRSSSFEFYHCFNAHCTFSKNIQRYSFLYLSSPMELTQVRERILGRFQPPKKLQLSFLHCHIKQFGRFHIWKINYWSIIHSLSKFKKMMHCTVRKGEVETEFSSRQRKRSSSIFEQTGNFWCRIFSNRFRLSCVQRQDLSITLLASIAILVMTNREKIVANLSK